MIKENCFGIIPLTYRENYWEVFIVLHLKGNYWGFPKGHAEKGESPKEAAEREMKEETGMSVIRYLLDSYLTERYQFPREGQLIDKTVHFYLAEVTTEFSIEPEEIVEGKWIALKDLLSYYTFKEEKELFQDLIKVLS